MRRKVNVVRQMRRFLEPLNADTQWDGKYLIRCVRRWIAEMERLEAERDTYKAISDVQSAQIARLLQTGDTL